mmetsp:Transcript_7926/g.28180  ORF Transcript_7926/g.28180 Transcript_7926/m.28180 type:complete len:1141 (-) Transcript_7926:160-3582(-)
MAVAPAEAAVTPKGPADTPKSTGTPSGFAGSGAISERSASKRLAQEESYTGPWQPPSKEKALRKRRKAMFMEGKGTLCGTTLDDDLQQLGTGMDLYFRTLCWFTVAFSILTVFAIPALILTTSGQRFGAEDKDPMGLVVFTIGNNGFPPEVAVNGTEITEETKTVMFGSELSSERVTYIITFFDWLGSLFFMAFVLFYKARTRLLVDEIDEDTITAQDFGIFVKGLPEDATKEEIVDFFSNLYDLSKEDYEHKGACGCCNIGGKKKRPAAPTWDGKPLEPNRNTGNSGDILYMNKWVTEVAIAQRDGAAIRKFMAQKKLLVKLQGAKSLVQKYSPRSPDTANAEKLAKAEAKLAKLQAKLDKIIKKNVKAAPPECLGAFVMFAYEEQQYRCLHDFRHEQSMCYRRFTAPQLKFRGKHRLDVKEGPDPSNIIWENIETSPNERFLRRLLTNIIVFILLVISIALLYQAQQAKTAFAGALPPGDVCSDHIFAAHYGTYDFPETAAFRRGTADQDEACGIDTFRIEVYDKETGELANWDDAVPGLDEDDYCTSNCVPLASDDLCEYPDDTGNLYWEDDAVACTCLALLVDLVNANGIVTGGQMAKDQHGDLCTEVATNFIASQSLLIGAAVSVVVINFVLKVVLKILANFERHDTVSGQQSAVTIKIFLAQVLNTGVIVVLVNAALPNNAQFPITGVLQGEYTGFTAAWYSSVGVSILLTMFINIFVPHGAPLAKYFVLGPCKRACLSKLASNQPGLNAAFHPEKFNIGVERYPFVLNTLFVTMAYYSGLPLLLPMAAFAFFLFYWIDKLLILKMFERPARFDDAIARLTADLLPIALLIHIGVSMWMLGESDVLKSAVMNSGAIGGDNAESAAAAEEAYEEWKKSVEQWDYIGFFPIIVRANVFPIFLTFVFFFVAHFILRHVASGFTAVLLGCFHTLTCGRFVGLETKLHDADERVLFAHGVGYTDDFRILIPIHSKPARKKKKEGEVIPLDPEEDYKYRESLAKGHIKAHEKELGWDLVKEYDPADEKKLLHCFKVKRWTQDGEFDGVPYEKGKIMKTYQVVADTGLHTYDVLANPTYRAALFALKKGQSTMQAQSSMGSEPDSPKKGKSPPAAAAVAADVEAGGGAGEEKAAPAEAKAE